METETVESEEVQPGVILDFDKDGRIVGMEMLGLSTRTEPETCGCSSSRRHNGPAEALTGV